MSDMYYRSDKAHFLGNEALVRVRELISDSSEMPRIRVLADLPNFVRVRAELADLAVEVWSDPYASIGGFAVLQHERVVRSETSEPPVLPERSLKRRLFR
jgi:hypothetical protein